jgi:RNA methyltransferase, TrmH family
MITSTRNPKVQWVRALQSQPKARREAGAFVVEGVRLLEEAFQSGWVPELVFYSAGISERGMMLVERFRMQKGVVEEVTEAVLKAAGDTETPQGILAVLPFPSIPLPESPDFILILDSIRNPGNLGTILRTAAAAGIQAVLLSQGTADPYAPKVVRAGMGAHFRLPVQRLDWESIGGYLKTGGPGMRVFLADAGGGKPYSRVDLVQPLALILGGEAQGAGSEAQKLTGLRLHIPMKAEVESLNAGAAAAVLLFEVVRQRSPSSEPPASIH